MAERRRRHWLRWGLLAVLLVWVGSSAWHANKPLPDGFSQAYPWRPAQDVKWLFDLSWQGAEKQRYQQRIFDHQLELIDQARRLVVVDMFLFNDFGGSLPGQPPHRPLSDQLTEALIQARERHPEMPIIVISDSVNTVYGGLPSPHFQRLRKAGIEVVLTPLKPLPDSNPTWSGLWRLCCAWAGNSVEGGWLDNPFGEGEVTLRSYLRLLNFKANHRKTLLVDQGPNWRAVVSSANPHDGSSRHSNTALSFSGPAVSDLWDSERAVLELAGASIPAVFPAQQPSPPPDNDALRVRVLTEQAIRDAALAMVRASKAGDRLFMASFYLSHHDLVESLREAAERGVDVRALLDANRDAFGRKKNGVPNRPVAARLRDSGVAVRWCATAGEQCHSKWLMHIAASGQAQVISGSANFTRRNIDGFNLETSVQLAAPSEHPRMREASDWFRDRWLNREGRTYSLAYDSIDETGLWRDWQYRVMEATGLSTF